MYSSSLRNRSGSVGRGERDSDSPSLYKTRYGSRSDNASTSNLPRYSRASSYDPFSVGSSRTQMTSSYRNPSSSMTSSSSSYRTPSMSSSLRNPSMSSSYCNSTMGLSNSYHSDYKSRYGSIDQLNSVSSYKSPYSTRSNEAERSSGRLSRAPASSAMRSSGYMGGSSRDLSSTRDSYMTSLAKYRPPETVSRPTYTPTSYSTPRTEYRSKTPGLSLSTRDLSQTRASRLDREYKSMTRFEKTPVREPSVVKDAVEETFQKLYNRYVRDVDLKEETKPSARKFISHSEAEEDTTDDDSEISTKSLSTGKISIETDFEVVDDEKTPQCSPKKDERKNDSAEEKRTVPEGVKIESKLAEKELSPQEVKVEAEEVKDAVTRFIENHPDVTMTNVVIPHRELRPASSAMDKLLRRDSLTLKLTEAMEKKKVAPPIAKANTAKLTATVSISGLITTNGSSKDKLDPIIERSRTPNSKTPEKSPTISKESSPVSPGVALQKPPAQITVTKDIAAGPIQSKSASPKPTEDSELTLRRRSRSPSAKKSPNISKESTPAVPPSQTDAVTRNGEKSSSTSGSKEPTPSLKVASGPIAATSPASSKEVSPMTTDVSEKSLRRRSRSPSAKKLKTPDVSKDSSPVAGTDTSRSAKEVLTVREKTPIANGTSTPREKSVTPSTLPPAGPRSPSLVSKDKSPTPLESTGGNLTVSKSPSKSVSPKPSEGSEQTLRRRSRSPSAKKAPSISKESTPAGPPSPAAPVSKSGEKETAVLNITSDGINPSTQEPSEKSTKLRSRSSSVKRRSATPKREGSVVKEDIEKTSEKTPEKTTRLERAKLKTSAEMLSISGVKAPKSGIPKPKPPPLKLNPTTEEPSTSVTILCPPAKTRSVSPLPSHLQENNQEMSLSASGSDPDLEREERSKSVGELERRSIRKRRDPTRTLESLKESLEAELGKKKVDDTDEKEYSPMVTSMPNVCIPPLLLVTQPSCPATPTQPTHNEVFFEVNQDDSWSDDEDEEVDYESDFEYSISQTFKVPDKTPLDLYSASSRNSPFVSDYDSDSSMPFLAGTRAEESRGRVDRLFAVPPPTFTCSVTYDGQESWDSSDSVHSCEEEFDDAYTVCPRPGSSSLGLYLSPAEYSSDETEDPVSMDNDYDGDHFHDSVQVGFTLKLVDKAAMRESYEDEDEYYDDEYYEEEEEEYTDEDEEYWESDEYTEEEVEVEDEEDEMLEAFEEIEEYSSEDEMMTVMEDAPIPYAPSQMILPSAMTASMAEEMYEFEECEDDFEVENTFEMAMAMEIDREEGNANKQREVTYTKDMEMMTKEERTDHIQKDKELEERAIAKRIKKDGTSEKAAKLVVTQRVNQMEEQVAESNAMEMEDMELLELEGEELPEITGSSEVTVVPTFVRSQTEKVSEADEDTVRPRVGKEQTSRFAERKPTSDWAKKAVIQPTKLETAKVEKVETKIGEKPQQKKAEPEKVMVPSGKIEEKKPVSTLKDSAKVLETQKPTSVAAPAPSTVPSTATEKSKPVEDKSSIRKSALNMKEEEASRKVKADEEAAKQKARRFGTVNALMSRFKDEKKEPEPITYKRSSLLEPKEEARPKKKYEVVKPVINDEFDKQLEELRSQMKTGASQFQNQLKDFSKGISTVSEEAKKRELEEKHKDLLNKTSGTFSKADEEKQRWKERRDAETDRELARIQDKTTTKKKVIITPAQATAEQPKEPKRTVRKIIREKKDPSVAVPSFATTGAEKGVGKVAPPPAVPQPPPAKVAVPVAPVVPVASVVPTPQKIIPTTQAANVPEKTPQKTQKPVLQRADSFQKPTIPQPSCVINENNFDLFAAATAVATKRRKSIIELKAQKVAEKQTKTEEPTLSGTIERTVSPSVAPKVPKGDGAAATKIRNALGNATNNMPGVKADRTVKRYSTRRRTQEIVNESVQKKCRRKEKQRKNKFINNVQDIDVLLGWEKENTFDKMDSFILRNNQRIARDNLPMKKRRIESSRVWISDLMDIDKIYKPSEIRDIIASVDL